MKGKKRRETLFRENADLYHSGEGPPASGNRLPAPPARTAPAPTSRDYVGEGHIEVKDTGLYDPTDGVSMPDLPPPPPPGEDEEQHQGEAPTPMSAGKERSLTFAEQLPSLAH